MRRTDLFDTFRRRANDQVKPYLWGDDELQEFLDDAHAEAAERALLLRDSTTAEVCEVAISADVAEYELDPRIIQVLRAKLDSQQRPLEITSTAALDREQPGWQQRTGSPTDIAIDAEGAGWKATLVGVPGMADVLRLQVHRLPLAPIAADNDEPEINPRLHVRLVDWMMFRAYSKKDAETFDETKAREHAADFETAFGPRQSANTRRTQFDRSPNVVQFREMG